MNTSRARTPGSTTRISGRPPDVFAGCDRAIALRQAPFLVDESTHQHEPRRRTHLSAQY
jgi:hypothetical protein